MKRKRWRLLALALVLLYLLFKAWCGGGEEKVALNDDILVNRPWIERMPSDAKDPVHGMMFTDQEFGVVAFASAFHWNVDVVEWKMKGDEIALHFLQEDKDATYRARLFRCEKEAPAPFELCLTLEGEGKTYRYFSRDDWRVRQMPSDAPALTKALTQVP